LLSLLAAAAASWARRPELTERSCSSCCDAAEMGWSRDWISVCSCREEDASASRLATSTVERADSNPLHQCYVVWGMSDEGGSAGPQRMQACLKKLGTALDGAHRAVFVPAPRVTWHHSRRAAAASYSHSGAVTVAPASYDASEDSIRYKALMSSSSAHAASYLTGQAVLRHNKKRLSK
jgi:hypothetical protein